MLFEPLTIGSLVVGGRVFKAPTTETRGSADGFVTDRLLEFYEPIARAGTPLIVTGMLYVNTQGKAFRNMCGIDADDKIPGLRRWADLVHGHGSRLFAQLGHCGRQVFPSEVGLESAVAASGVRDKLLGTKPRPMTRDEIRNTVQDFGAAAERAREAGFDGVQIMAAVGYLLSSFLTPYTNRRRDEYGGSPRNRMRFMLEVLREVKDRAGDGFPVTVRLNGTDSLRLRAGLDTPELLKVALALESEGLDGIEITASHYESGMMAARGRFDDFFRVIVTDGRLSRGLRPWRRHAGRLAAPLLGRIANRAWGYREGFLLPYAREFKAALGIPVIAVGGFQTRSAMETALATEQCDALSVARAMVADPFLYRHLRDGIEGPRCTFCSGCMARVGTHPIACYEPRVAAEQEAMLAAERWSGAPASGAGPDCG